MSGKCLPRVDYREQAAPVQRLLPDSFWADCLRDYDLCTSLFGQIYPTVLHFSLFDLYGIVDTELLQYHAYFAVPLYSISLINYLALYLAPIPLTIYIREEVYNLKLRLLAIAYRVFLAIELAAVSVMVTLHTLDIVHLAGMLKYMQAILFIGLLFFLYVLLLNLKFSKLEIGCLFWEC